MMLHNGPTQCIVILAALLWLGCSAPRVEPEARVNRDRIESDAYIVDKIALAEDYLPAMSHLSTISEAGDSLFGGRVNWITRKYVHPGEMQLEVDQGEQVFVQFYHARENEEGQLETEMVAKVEVKPVASDTTVAVAMDDVFEVAQEKYMLFLVIRDGVAVLKHHTFLHLF